MSVLSLDTTMAACSAALSASDTGVAVAARFAAMPNGQAEVLPGMIEAVMKEAGQTMAQISSLAVTTGPGSFTGVRIGIAMARGLALALAVPVTGLTSLAVIAAAARATYGEVAVLVASDARRGGLFIEHFSSTGETLAGPALVALEEAQGWCPEEQTVIAGSGAEVFIAACQAPAHLEKAQSSPLPDARHMGALAAALKPQTSTPVPLYLRKPDAKPQNPLIALKHD